MRRRALVPLLALAAVVAAVALLPQTPVGRGWLLDRLRSGLQGSGIELDVHASRGNPWRGLALEGVRVKAPGVDVTAAAVDVRYFLPSLLAGELPLSVSVRGLRGSLDLRALRDAGGAGAPSLPVVPVLQELTVSDAALTVEKVPYTLPDGAVTDIRIRQRGSSLDLQAHLRTADGSADASGVLDLSGPRFDGQVSRADVTLARHWFPGAGGGIVTGPLHIGPDGIHGDFTLRGGSLDAIGLTPGDIHGLVELRYPLIHADLQGSALGGPVAVQGTVNIAARQWQAHATGTPQLQRAMAWIFRDSTAALPVELSGGASTTIDASGWTHIALTGSADGSGSVEGLPVDQLQADFSYDTQRGVSVQATTRLAGGSAAVTVASGPDGTRVEGDVRQVVPLAGHSVDGSLQLLLGASGGSGSLHLSDALSVAGRAATVTVEAGLNSDGWQAVIQGSDAEGARLEGALALNAGGLSGEVRAHDLRLPHLSEPATFTLRADGPTTALPLTLGITAPAPLGVSAGPEVLATDLRGQLTATLQGGVLRSLHGALGPLTVAGELALAPLQGTLTADLPATPITGPVRADLSLTGVRIDVGGGAVGVSGGLDLGTVTAGPLALTPGRWTLSAPTDGSSGVTAATASGAVRLRVLATGLAAQLSGLPVGVWGRPGTLTGSATLPFGTDPLDGARGSLTGSLDGATVALRAGPGPWGVDVTAPAGTTVGPIRLAEAVQASGSFDPHALAGRVAGTLGTVPVVAEASSHAGAWQGQLGVGAGLDRLEARAAATGWSVRGSLPLAPLAAVVGLRAQGTLTADLALDGSGYTGTARVRTTAPLAATADLLGSGRELAVELSAQAAGQPLTARGSLLPELRLDAEVGPLGPVHLAGGRLTGFGTLPARPLAAGAELGPLPWTLAGTLAPLDLRLDLGQGRARLLGGRWAARLRLPLDYGGTTLTADIATGGTGAAIELGTGAGVPSVAVSDGLAAIPLVGRVASAAGTELLTVAGTPAALDLQGTLPAGLVASPLPAALRPAGEIDVRGSLALEPTLDYRLAATWRAAPSVLQADLSGRGSDYRLSVHGDGLTALARPGRVTVSAEGLALAPLLPALGTDVTVNGALAVDAGTWTGALHLRGGAPFGIRADLLGDAETLHTDVSATPGPLRVELQGTVLPAPRLDVTASGWDQAVQLSGTTSGSWRALTVAGSLTTGALALGDAFALEPQRAAWSWSPWSGELSVAGAHVDLHGSPSDLRGSVALPFRALGVDERFDARLKGPLPYPEVDATVVGHALSGSVTSGADGTVRAELTAARATLRPFLGSLAGPFLAADPKLVGHVAPDGVWQASLDGALGSGGTVLPVRLRVDGRGRRYQGQADLLDSASGPTLARATVTGEGADLRAALDLATVDTAALGALAGVQLDLRSSGTLAVSTAPLGARLDLHTDGSVAGTPVTLDAGAGAGRPVTVHAVVAGTRLDVGPGSDGDPRIALRSADGGVDVHGSLHTGAAPGLSLDGAIAGATLTTQAQLDPASGKGDLHVRLGDASLDVALAPTDAALGLTLTVRAPPASLGPLGSRFSGDLDAHLTLATGRLTLDALRATDGSVPTSWSLALAGEAYPSTDLTGSFDAATLGAPVDLALHGSPNDLRATARIAGLQAGAVLRGPRLRQVTLNGSATLSVLPAPLTLSASDLRWTPDGGFAGNATAETAGRLLGLPGMLRAELSGSGSLDAAVTAGPTDAPWLRGSARVAADPVRDPSFNGALELSLPVASWLALPTSAELRLVGTPTLAGRWDRPTLDGDLRLQGGLDATGPLHLDGASGTLDLKGTGIALALHLDRGAWDGSLDLSDVALGPFDPRLNQVALSLKATVAGGAGTALHANVTDLNVAAPGGSLTGTAALGDGVRAALQVRADLASLALPGPALSGVVHGPLVLVAPDLAHVRDGTVVAVLDIAHLGLVGTDGTVDGTLQLGGTPADPQLSATLQGAGAIRGQVRFDAAPTRGRLDLHSTLGYRSLTTDLAVVARDGRIDASGEAHLGAAVLHLSSDAAGGLVVDGGGPLDGWRATVAGDLTDARLQGSLAALGYGASGDVHVEIGGSPWLRGDIAGAGVGGIPLGDLSLVSTAPGAAVQVSGPHLGATLDPTTLAWQAHVDGLPVPPGAAVRGSAQGRALTGQAQLDYAGSAAGTPFDVRVTASNRAGVVVDAAGTAFGGSLSLQSSRPTGGAWYGDVHVTDARIAGSQASFAGTLTGQGPIPVVDGTLTSAGAIAGSSTVRAGPSGVHLDATLESTFLKGKWRLTGALAPRPDLTIAAVGGSGASPGRIRLFTDGGVLAADGRIALRAGPLAGDLRGDGPGAPVVLGLRLPAVAGLAFTTELPGAPAAALVSDLVAHGLTLSGSDATSGELQLAFVPALRADLHDVRLERGGAVLSASGAITPSGGDLTGALVLPRQLPVEAVGGATLPYRLALDGGKLSVTSDGELGTVRADLDLPAGIGHVSVGLHTLGSGGGTASADLTFDPARGPSGSLTVDGVRVTQTGLPTLTIASSLNVASGRATGDVDLASASGGVRLQGAWGLGGWLPASLAPVAPAGGSAEVRIRTFRLDLLPSVKRLAPNLQGAVSGVLQLRDSTVVGQLVAPDLAVAGTRLPLDAQISGAWSDLNARLKIADSVVTGTVRGGRVAGLIDLHRFPAQVLAEAATGPTDIRADVDGVVRFDVPLADPAAGYLRMATEAIRLERSGVVTTGSLAWVYDAGSFTVERASFDGRGHWQAQGTVEPDRLDLTLQAQNADFGPLLGLVPMLARYGVGAAGSFMLTALGTPAQPDVTLTANGLEAQVAGTHYRIASADARLAGSDLTATARIAGVAPLGGALQVRGSAQLTLAPLALRRTSVSFSGSAELPVLGAITDVQGGITQPSGSTPQLELSGTLGHPFTAKGSLAPFDVTVKGQGLDLRASPLFVTSSSVDVNVRLRGTRRGLAVGGTLDASEIRMDLAGAASGTASAPSSTGPAPSATPPVAPPGPGTAAAASGGPAAAGTSTAPSDASASTSTSATAAAASAVSEGTPSGSRAALQAIVFDGLRLRAPQRVLLDASFGTAEVALDLTLTGTAAAPQLDGTASALRGSLRFAGRDFTVDRAVATFQQGRGVYPSLDVQAHTTFDKRRVLAGTTDVSFASPADSSTFTVTLAFTGQLQQATSGPSPFTFDVRPTLTSDATVQVNTAGAAGSPRALSDQELLSLITLGRLEVRPQLAGQSGIGTAVAQSAIDTAVDVLVVNELQNALSKALGLDVVEIRTSPLSSLLDSSGQPFGVSLRLGGYLTPELFASYRLGNVTDSGQSYAFTNEVSLTYDLGPLNVDLSGRLSFPDAATPGSPVPELGVGLRYAFTPGIGLEAGVDLSNVRQQARFGVSLRW